MTSNTFKSLFSKIKNLKCESRDRDIIKKVFWILESGIFQTFPNWYKITDNEKSDYGQFNISRKRINFIDEKTTSLEIKVYYQFLSDKFDSREFTEYLKKMIFFYEGASKAFSFLFEDDSDYQKYLLIPFHSYDKSGMFYNVGIKILIEDKKYE